MLSKILNCIRICPQYLKKVYFDPHQLKYFVTEYFPNMPKIAEKRKNKNDEKLFDLKIVTGKINIYG